MEWCRNGSADADYTTKFILPYRSCALYARGCREHPRWRNAA